MFHPYRRYFDFDANKLIDKLFDTRLPMFYSTTTTESADVYTQKTETGTDVIFKLPGFAKDDVELTLEGQTFKVEAHKEDKYLGVMDFEYEYYVPFKVKTVTSKMENGVLIVSVVQDVPEKPKIESTRIAIE